MLGEETRRAQSRLCHSPRAGGALGSPVENKMRSGVLTSWLPRVITAQADALPSDVGIGLRKNGQWPGVLNLGTLKMSNLCSYLWILIKLVRTRV